MVSKRWPEARAVTVLSTCSTHCLESVGMCGSPMLPLGGMS